MKRLVSFLLLGLCLNGCSSVYKEWSSKLPCYPASYYAEPTGASYVAKEVQVPVAASHVLVGTLTIPRNIAEAVPAIVLISGSHAQIRDMVGSTTEPVSFYQPFRQIADVLGRRGIAVLRLDDRGTGCSDGESITKFNTAERTQDTLAALRYLRGRKDIDTHRIGLLGISEGANIAIMIAAAEHDLRAVVTMAASASPGWQIWEYQTRYLISLGEEMDDAKRARWLSGEDPEKILKERVAEARAHVNAGKADSWWTFFFSFDPSTVATKVVSPILILHGDKDSNVPVTQAHKLAQAIKANGNQDVTVKIFSNHNHLFLPDTDGGFRKYPQLLKHTNQIPEAVLEEIADWLEDRGFN